MPSGQHDLKITAPVAQSLAYGSTTDILNLDLVQQAGLAAAVTLL